MKEKFKYLLFIAYFLFITTVSGTTVYGINGLTWLGNSTFDNTTINWDARGNVTILGTWSDEFNTGSLDTNRWYWVRQNPAAWLMGSTFVQLNNTNTDMWGATATAPLLLQNYTGNDISIILNISAVPTANYEGGGIMVYADDTNWLKGMYYYNAGVKKIIFAKEYNNIPTSTETTITSNPIYLALDKAGIRYTLSYSTNLITWTNITQYAIPANVSLVHIGMSSHGAPSAAPQPFKYDSFITNNFTRWGNLTIKNNAELNSVSNKISGNFTFPGNTNATVSLYNNDTGAYIQSWTNIVSPSWSQSIAEIKNLSVNITLFGDLTNTPQILNFTLSTITVTPTPTPTPTPIPTPTPVPLLAKCEGNETTDSYSLNSNSLRGFTAGSSVFRTIFLNPIVNFTYDSQIYVISEHKFYVVNKTCGDILAKTQIKEPIRKIISLTSAGIYLDSDRYVYYLNKSDGAIISKIQKVIS